MTRTHDLTTWLESHTEEMVRWAFQKTSSEEMARDLVQDTFLAVEKYENFQGKSTPKAWLFAILNNKIVYHYRKQVRQPTISADNLFNEVFDENCSWQSHRVPKDWHQDRAGHAALVLVEKSTGD